MSTLQLKAQLQKLGLQDKESEIYLACLKHSPLNPTALAHITKINRSTLYLYVDHLKALGLILDKTIGKRRYITTAPLSLLANIIEERKNEVDEQSKILYDLIPSLEKMVREKSNPESIEILQGKAGVVALIEKIIKAKRDIHWIGSFETLLSVIKDEKLFKLLTWRRMDQKTTSYAITDRSILRHKKYSDSQGLFRQFKFIDSKTAMKGIAGSFADKLFFFTVKEGGANIILITDTLVKEIFLFMFKTLWEKLD